MKIGFIGAGNMGSALANAAAHGAKDTEVYLYDKDTEKAKAFAARIGGSYAELPLLCGECDLVFIGVKPNVVADVAEQIRGKIKEGATLVSMAAGMCISRLLELFGDMPIIRIMPNTPVGIGKGVILWAKNGKVTDGDAERFLVGMSAAGSFFELEEGLMDAGTAVSGCGPAFVYTFIDAMARGGEAAGLDYAEALLLAARTAEGAARMIIEDSRSPKELTRAVCSPGGSTIEGVRSLERDGVEERIANAVIASFNRTRELGK